MEGQDLNPEPTTEPVPQDSFAEPTANTGASWQPQQATAPQVGGMNVPPAAAAPVQQPAKNNMGIIIAIAVAGVILVGLIIAIIIVAINGAGGSSSGSASKPEEKPAQDTEALKLAQRNTQREDDIARFLTAVNDYQTNNSGRTPFGTTGVYDKTTINNFVRRYIDSDIDSTGVAEGKSFVCSKNKTCPQFKDPDGTIYGFTVDMAKTNATDEKIAYSGDIDHMMHVYVNAGCGDEDGTYTTGTGNRQIAMFYILEGGKIACNDNH